MLRFCRALVLAAAVVLLGMGTASHAQWLNTPLRLMEARQAPRPPDSVLVKFKPGRAVAGLKRLAAPRAGDLVHAPALTHLREIPRLGVQVYRLGDPNGMQAALDSLRRMEEVLYAEPNFRTQLLIEPNDFYYALEDTTHALFPPDDHWPYQWPLHFIEAASAWSVWPNQFYTAANKPANAVRVAVIDTGIDVGHPDFRNAGGASTNSAQGGQLDLANSRNMVAGGNNPSPNDPSDDYGHGTHVAGTIGAATNNTSGVAAIGYNGRIMMFKVTDFSGDGDDADVVDAIVKAADLGALIINISLALNGGYSQALQDAINYAWQKNVLVVAAAGNDGVDYVRRYPAACNKVLAVGATTFASELTIPPYESRASYSNAGLYVGVSAPGGDASYFNGGEFGLIPELYTLVWSTTPTYDTALTLSGITEYEYGYLNGTSMAAPHVAGLATLLAGYKNYTQSTAGAPRLMMKAIQKGADNLAGRDDGGWTTFFGHGRINANNTMRNFFGFGRSASTPGCITGQVTYFGTPVMNASITAVKNGTTRKFNASSKEDGTFRIANLPVGTYTVTYNYIGLLKTKTNVVVEAACDTPATDMDMDASGVSVTVTPHTANVSLGGSFKFTATVAGASNQGVIWSVIDGPGTIGSDGTYYAPDTLGSTNIAEVQATSLADPTKFDIAEVTITATSPGPETVTLNPSIVWATQPSTATVTLSANAPASGLVVNLSSSNTAVARTPVSVTVPAGTNQATFTVTTLNITTEATADIVASANGQNASATITVKVAMPSTMTLNPTSVYGGAKSTATLTLTGPAPTGGLKFNLTSSNTAAATTPLTATVGAGKTVGTFAVTTNGVASQQTPTITATARGVPLEAVLTVKPAVPKTITFVPTTVVGGNSVTATLTLYGKAPAGGLVVTLSSDKPTVGKPPVSVTVPAGSSTANFTVTTFGVAANTVVKITATANGTGVTKSFTVTP